MEKSKHNKSIYKGIIIGSIMTIAVLGMVFHKNLVVDGLLGRYNLLNPIITYHEGKYLMEEKEINFHEIVNEYIDTIIDTGKAEHISVYYRALNNGDRLGVHETSYFSPASLMKIQILIAYLKKSETEKGTLEKKILYRRAEEDAGYKQNIQPKEELQDGKEYTVQQLLGYMIKYSSNSAALILRENIEFGRIKDSFHDLGMGYPQLVNGSFDNNVRVKDYGSFFRILFNGSYLNKDDSEKALEMLTETVFQNGLRADIPDNIIIAHKFGERGIIGKDGKEQEQLHDCGIIYFPKHPYILCIMTRGEDREVLKSIIKGISNLIYNELKKTYEI